MKQLSVIYQWMNRLLLLLAGAALVAMILLTCANIVLRALVAPISGTFELMGFFGAVVAAFSLGYTQLQRGHISVDVLIQRFPPRIRSLLTAVNSAVCALFFALIAWQVAEKAAVLKATGEVTETLRIVYYPFTYGTALGCAFLSLVLAKQLLEVVRSGSGGKGK